MSERQLRSTLARYEVLGALRVDGQVALAALTALALLGCPAQPPPDLPPPCEQPLREACGARQCGAVLDVCGRLVGCGSCAEGFACAAAGRCEPVDAGCVPEPTRACADLACGVVDAGCATSVSCGTCAAPLSCGGGGVPHQCGVDGGQPTSDGGSDGGARDGGADGGVDGGGADGGGPGGFSCPSARATVDRPDDTALPALRALYVLPSDGVDDAHDTNGRICTSVRSFNTWLTTQVGRALRFDTAAGELDVGFVRLSRTDAELRGTGNVTNVDAGIAYVRDRIERELQQLGQLRTGKLYAVWYGGHSDWACGGAAYPPQLPGQVVAMYLKTQLPSSAACEAAPWGTSVTQLHYFDWAMLHDLLHGLGVVADQAPHHHSFGHAFDSQSNEPERDLMYAPRTGSDPYWATLDPRGLILDIDRDDYAGHDGGFVDLRRSAFLQPTPPGAQLPPGW